MFQCVKAFLASHLEGKGPLLLGCSGGIDSLALFHLLVEVRRLISFDLHVAHIDHGWREESRREAEILKNYIESFAIPFHLHTLAPIETGANLEDRCRTLRLEYFSSLQRFYNYQALLLAHHADDQAEVILKRVCEGAGLHGLGGLREEKRLGELLIWRPLLPIRKKELVDYLTLKKLTPFDDRTNRDNRFLRARMRTEIFPELEKSFGKQIGKNFSQLGEFFQELQEYFHQKILKIQEQLLEGPFGYYLSLAVPYHPLEMEFFITQLGKKEEAHLSYRARKTLLYLIQKKAPNHQIVASPLTFIVNGEHLFILRNEFPKEITKWEKTTERMGWKEFWMGKIYLPDGVESVLCFDELEEKVKKTIKKKYQSQRIPPFLHSKAPIFAINGKWQSPLIEFF